MSNYEKAIFRARELSRAFFLCPPCSLCPTIPGTRWNIVWA